MDRVWKPGIGLGGIRRARQQVKVDDAGRGRNGVRVFRGQRSEDRRQIVQYCMSTILAPGFYLLSP
jgi:hypothetical protein